MQSCSISDISSHLEQNCCKHTRFGTCLIVLSERFVSCVFSKSQNTYSTCSLQAGTFTSGRVKQRWPTSSHYIDTEPFVAFVLPTCNQSAARTTKLAKLTCALPFTLRFPFVVIEACLSPKVSVAQVTMDSRPRVFTRRTYHTFATCLLTSVYQAIFTALVATLTNILFSHNPCEAANDVILKCHIVK